MLSALIESRKLHCLLWLNTIPHLGRGARRNQGHPNYQDSFVHFACRTSKPFDTSFELHGDRLSHAIPISTSHCRILPSFFVPYTAEPTERQRWRRMTAVHRSREVNPALCGCNALRRVPERHGRDNVGHGRYGEIKKFKSRFSRIGPA